MLSKVELRKEILEWLAFFDHHDAVAVDDSTVMSMNESLLDTLGYEGPEPKTVQESQTVLNLMILKALVTL